MYSDGLVEDSAAAQAASKAAPSALLPASRIPQGPPRASRAASQRSSERSASASKAGQDSSSTLRRRFLSRVAQVTMWSLWEASDLAASSLPSGSGAGNRASGMPSAVLAMTAASRSSVVYCQPHVDKIGVVISTLSAFCVPTAFPTSEICQA